jgi:hydroxyacylglutathione hydrolase
MTKVQTLFTPCHTPGHVCYYIPSTPGIVFSGDTMFVGGCGNFNNGTPQQMYENMLLKLGSLPRETLVYVNFLSSKNLFSYL